MFVVAGCGSPTPSAEREACKISQQALRATETGQITEATFSELERLQDVNAAEIEDEHVRRSVDELVALVTDRPEGSELNPVGQLLGTSMTSLYDACERAGSLSLS